MQLEEVPNLPQNAKMGCANITNLAYCRLFFLSRTNSSYSFDYLQQRGAIPCIITLANYLAIQVKIIQEGNLYAPNLSG